MKFIEFLGPRPLLILALVGSSACSQSGFVAGTTTSSSRSPSAPRSTSHLDSEYATADSKNQILAYQDLSFRFRIPGFMAGDTATVQNAPAWLSVDNARGELSGTPVLGQNAPQLQIQLSSSGGSSTVGPYQLVVVGDAFKAYQWFLENTGQKTFSALGGVAGEDINLKNTVKDRILGKGIRIAISDTGLVESHPKLSPNLILGASRNYAQDFGSTGTWVGNSTPGIGNAGNAHGTAVAGLAAERGWQGTGGRGVAPLAGIAGFLFIQAQSTLFDRGYLTTAHLDQFAGNFDIFNYSWGDSQCAFSEYDNNYRNKLLAGVTNLRSGKGAIYVKAAGNEFAGTMTDCYSNAMDSDYFIGNSNFNEDNTTPYTLIVGALTASGKSSSYSSPGSNIWVSAPGGEFGWNTSASSSIYREPAMLTTDFIGCSRGIKTYTATKNPFDAGGAPNSSCTHTATMNGTSSATPVVSGATALILAANPDLSWRDVKHILASTAQQVDPSAAATTHPATGGDLAGHTYQEGWVTNQAGFKFHNWYGFGRVDVDAAVTMAKSYSSSWGPLQQTNTGSGGSTWKYGSGTLNLAIPGGDPDGVSRTLNVTENLAIEAVQVQVSADGCIGNLGLEITSPRGTKSILMNINSYLWDMELTSHIFLTNAFYGEASNGIWTLKAIGGESGCNAQLRSWQLNVFGH